MKRINTKFIDFVLYVISLYTRKRYIVTCDNKFCGYAYSSYPVRRYFYTFALFAALVAGLLVD